MTSAGAATELRYVPVTAGRDDCIAVLSLDRPDAANSFNDAVIRELVAHVDAVGKKKSCRALVLRGKGKHFSAGADLEWMKASAKLSFEANVKDSHALTALFEGLANLQLPTLGVVTGSAFGGAVGLTACCDVAIAEERARFCLSEIKLGLMPAVILPYLARKMRPGALRRYGLTGRLFSASEALACGLVERVVPEPELGAAIRDELSGFLQGAPEAQAVLKSLLHRVTTESQRQGAFTAEAIAAQRTGAVGQAGLAAFFAKNAPPWAATLDGDFTLDGPSR